MKNTIILSVFIFLTVIITWPLFLHLDNYVIDRYDGLLITWFLNWPLHFFSTGGLRLQELYNANIFYPYKMTLAFSETMFPQAIIAAPFVILAGEPLLAYNINFLLGFILTTFSSFLLIKQLTKDYSISFLGALLFSFSTIHLNYLAHLQLFNFWPTIFTVLFLIQKRFKLYVSLFIVATLTTLLNFYFLLLIISVVFIYQTGERLKLVVYSLAAIFFSIPFFLPYLLVTRQFNNIRPINDAIHFSLQFPDLLNISSMSRLSAVVPPTSNLTPAYFGGVFLIMFLIMIWKIRKKIPNNKHLRLFLVIALMAFMLSLGPALHIFSNTVHIGPIPAVPLPYAVFYYLIPGFSGFRTPSRWILLTAFSLSMAIGIYFAKRVNLKLLILLSLLILLEVNFPFQYSIVPSVKEFPPEQIWLKDHYQGAPIIQFPIYSWDDRPGFGEETLREYYSTIHWHPMFNGYSGFSPKDWEAKVKWLQKDFPSPDSIGYLKSIGIKLILAPVFWHVPLKLVANFPNVNIYEL